MYPFSRLLADKLGPDEDITSERLERLLAAMPGVLDQLEGYPWGEEFRGFHPAMVEVETYLVAARAWLAQVARLREGSEGAEREHVLIIAGTLLSANLCSTVAMYALHTGPGSSDDARLLRLRAIAAPLLACLMPDAARVIAGFFDPSRAPSVGQA